MMLLSLLACPPKHAVPSPVVEDPAAFLAEVRAEPPPGPVAVPFAIRIVTPENTIHASGTLVVSPPARFRLELRGPIGGPALLVAGDGTSIVAWQAAKNIFYTLREAETSIRTLTGGAAGLDGAAALLLGRLPDLGEPATQEIVAGRPRYEWVGPTGARVMAELDPATRHLTALEAVDAVGTPWLTAALLPAEYPEALHVSLPPKDITADLDFGDWMSVTPADAVFTLAPPPGAEMQELRLAE